MSGSVKHRRKLNTEQILVLELLYRFRFGSNELFAWYFEKSDRSFVHRRLAILQELGFIGKRFEPSYRLRGRPVAYYLLPDGARMFNQCNDRGYEVNIKAIYKDGTVSERFIDHCLAVFTVYSKLVDEYGEDEDMDFFSRAEQANYANFPKPLPDAYVRLWVDDNAKHFFIDVIDDDAHLLIDASKKIKRFIEYKKSGDWVLIDKAPFPKIIFVCNTEQAAQKVQKRCDAILRKTWLLDIEFEVVAKDIAALG